jgi:hypothetical protein
MSTENNPYLTVPDYGQLNQNFGAEKLYSGYSAPSAVADLAAAAKAADLQTGARTPDKGKYVYDSQTGQYIWVPATAAAAVNTGLAASPAYMNQDRSGPGGGSELGATSNNTGGVNTNRGIVSNVLSSPMMGKIGNFFGGKQVAAPVESRTGISTKDNQSIADMAEAEGVALGPQATGKNSGKPGETAVGGTNYGAPIGTIDGLTSRGITSGVTADVDSAVDAAPAADSDTGKDTGADSVSGGGGGGGGGRVICTHFYRKGEMDRNMWRADLEFTFKRLSPITVRGYQYWAIPYVKLMRKSKLAEDIIRPLAFARARELTYQMGRSPKGSVFGKAVRLVFEPLCFAIGLFVGEQNWQALWTPVKD